MLVLPLFTDAMLVLANVRECGCTISVGAVGNNSEKLHRVVEYESLDRMVRINVHVV